MIEKELPDPFVMGSGERIKNPAEWPQRRQEIARHLGAPLVEQFRLPHDTSHDLLMAANAGVASLGVTYGAHERDDLRAHAPLALLDSFAEVHAWLAANA